MESPSRIDSSKTKGNFYEFYSFGRLRYPLDCGLALKTKWETLIESSEKRLS
jgi:hypothetical protein